MTAGRLLFAAVVLLVAGCSSDDAGSEIERLPSEPPPRASVPTATSASASGAPEKPDAVMRLTGTTVAHRQSAVAVGGMGLLRTLLVREGDMVKMGQTIAQLDSRGPTLQLRQAQAALRMAQVQLEAAEREHARLESLAKQNAVAAARLDEMATAHEAALAGVAQAALGVQAAHKALGDTVVVAPFDGLVVARLKAEGEWVSTMPPSPVILLAEVSPLDLTIEAPEHLLGRIHEGAAVTARFAAGNRTVHAQVTRVVRAVRPQTRSFTVIVEIRNQDHALEPGLFAQVEIAPGEAAK